MIHQFQPLEKGYIVRQLDNASDPATYYVRAVVKYAATNAVIATVNLTNQGNQLFSGSFNVPADSGGSGYYLYVITSVYTDSGYTTLSPVYATVQETYLVQLRFSPALGYGGTSLDPRAIREAIAEAIGLMPKGMTSKDVESSISRAFTGHGDTLSRRFGYLDEKYESLRGTLESMRSEKKKEYEAVNGAVARLHDVMKETNKDLQGTMHSLLQDLSLRFESSSKKGEAFSEKLLLKVHDAVEAHFEKLADRETKRNAAALARIRDDLKAVSGLLADTPPDEPSASVKRAKQFMRKLGMA